MPTSLVVVSDREPLAWMLRTSRFALPAGRAASAPRAGDTLILHTTRGCYRNPTRGRGLVMGVARVASEAAALDEPVPFRGRDFGLGLTLQLDGVCPAHIGVDLGATRDDLKLLAGDGTWSYRLRPAPDRRAIVRGGCASAAELPRPDAPAAGRGSGGIRAGCPTHPNRGVQVIDSSSRRNTP